MPDAGPPAIAVDLPEPVAAIPTARLALQGVCVDRGVGRVVSDVDLTIEAGEIVTLLGVNGAGKSTLLQAVVGLVPLAAGFVAMDGRKLEAATPERRAAIGIGYAPEGRRVFPGMTVRDNLLAVCRASAKERESRVESVFELFPQLQTRERALAWQLSGGQQQMLAIGRALMNLPRLLLLDEPTLGLSPTTVDDLLERLTWIAASGTAVLVAEQNTAVAAAASRVAVMRVGRIVLDAPAATVAQHRDRLERAMLG
ncbi:MAG: ABC transporter ATP-binding protein [Alphaproteobacteria bacterium]